jgi:hypothetical protein
VRSNCLRVHARVNNLEIGVLLMDLYDIVCGSLSSYCDMISDACKKFLS